MSLPHFGVQLELDAHLAEDAAAFDHHFLFQLEGRDTEGQQAADLRMTVIHHRFDAVAGQHVGAGQPAGSHRRSPRALPVGCTCDMSGFQPLR